MKKEGCLVLVFLTIILFSSMAFVSAESGSSIMNPDLSIKVKLQAGTIFPENVIVCYENPKYIGQSYPIEDKDPNYQYVKGILDSGNYNYCDYCENKENKCWSSFQGIAGVPKKMGIGILYPVYYYLNGTKAPTFYESDYFKLKEGIRTYNYEYEAMLNSDGTITLHDRTTQFSLLQLIFFVIALVLTIIIERLSTRFYFSRMLRKKMPDHMLRIIIWVNVISLPIFWFIFPFVIKNPLTLLIIGEVYVVLLEGLFIRIMTKKELTLGWAMELSIVNNIASFVVGVVVFLLIGGLSLI